MMRAQKTNALFSRLLKEGGTTPGCQDYHSKIQCLHHNKPPQIVMQFWWMVCHTNQMMLALAKIALVPSATAMQLEVINFSVALVSKRALLTHVVYKFTVPLPLALLMSRASLNNNPDNRPSQQTHNHQPFSQSNQSRCTHNPSSSSLQDKHHMRLL